MRPPWCSAPRCRIASQYESLPFKRSWKDSRSLRTTASLSDSRRALSRSHASAGAFGPRPAAADLDADAPLASLPAVRCCRSTGLLPGTLPSLAGGGAGTGVGGNSAAEVPGSNTPTRPPSARAAASAWHRPGKTASASGLGGMRNRVWTWLEAPTLHCTTPAPGCWAAPRWETTPLKPLASCPRW